LLGTSFQWSLRSETGGTRNAGFADIAPPVVPCPRWRSWSATTPDDCGSFLAVVVERNGVFSEPDVLLSIGGEGGLRLDYCEHCDGYLKTYSGMGNEILLMADWTSLHLDILARDRGLKRLAASLYEL
jgi:hypothetical protein